MVRTDWRCEGINYWESESLPTALLPNGAAKAAKRHQPTGPLRVPKWCQPLPVALTNVSNGPLRTKPGMLTTPAGT